MKRTSFVWVLICGGLLWLGAGCDDGGGMGASDGEMPDAAEDAMTGGGDADTGDADTDGDADTGDADTGDAGDAEMGDECEEDTDCDDGNQCTVDTCDNGFCSNEARDDGTMCEVGDDDQDDEICVDGDCGESRCGDGYAHGDEECDDGNNESGDGCEPDCTYTCVQGENDCDDANMCTADECVDHVCEHESANEGDPCGDNGVCRSGSCLPSSCDNDADCDDGKPCNGEETCDTSASPNTCRAGEPLDCDDGDPCTLNDCNNAEGGCVFQCIDGDNDGFVSDDKDCTSDSMCEATDCNDDSADIGPDEPEVCGNNTDDDCDGDIDEVGQTTWYADCDGDGFAASGASTMDNCEEPSVDPSECSAGSWTSTEPADVESTDCMDSNANVHPDHTKFEAEPIAGTDSDYDYDCSGSAEMQYTQNGSCSGGAAFCDLSQEGWASAETAGCGETANYLDGPEDCTGVPCSASPNDMRTQRCR